MNKISFTSRERSKILLLGITPFIFMFILISILDKLSSNLVRTYSYITAFVFIFSIAFIIFSLKFSYSKFDPEKVPDKIQRTNRIKRIANIFMLIAIIIHIPVFIFIYNSREIFSMLETNFDYSTYKQTLYTIALLVAPFTFFFLTTIFATFITAFLYMKAFFLKYQLNKINNIVN